MRIQLDLQVDEVRQEGAKGWYPVKVEGYDPYSAQSFNGILHYYSSQNDQYFSAENFSPDPKTLDNRVTSAIRAKIRDVVYDYIAENH